MTEMGSFSDVAARNLEVRFTPDTVAKVFLHHRLQILWAIHSTIE